MVAETQGSQKTLRLCCSEKEPPYVSLLCLELIKTPVVVEREWGKTTEFSIDGLATSADLTIARHLARLDPKAELFVGNSFLSQAEIESWVGAAGNISDGDESEARLAVLEAGLYRSKSGWFAHDRITLADVTVWVALHRSAFFARVTKNFPRLSAFYDKLMQDERLKSVHETVKQRTVIQSPKKEKSTTTGPREEAKFVDLPGAEMGKVVVRFPPEASGYLHIGHAKAAMLNQYYQETFKGQLIMRFDDTNPAKENEHFEKIILEDLDLLHVKPDKFSYTSNYFEQMLQFCEQLLKEGKAYVDDTEPDVMKKERELRVESRCRSQSPAENLRLWKLMKDGEDKTGEHGQRYAVRMKIDMKSDNGCMRDPTIYRCKLEAHIRTGSKYKVYPTYDFACPIVDSLEGVTHALRTTEYHDRDEQYYFILKALGMRQPYVWEYCRLSMMNTVMSKRKLTWLVNEGHVTGWDDPRFPTIRGVIRRGLTIEGLKQFILAQGSSRSVVFLDWDKIWAFNKKVLDPVVPRLTALVQDSLVSVNVSGQKETQTRTIDKHPKDPNVGQKAVWFGPHVFVEQEDAKLMEAGQTVTFVNWGNLKIDHVVRSEGGLVTSIDARLDLDNKDYKKTMKVTWLGASDAAGNIPVVCTHFDHLITKPVFAKDEDFKLFVNSDSEHSTRMLGEAELSNLRKGDVIQVQRKGFYICDQPYQAKSPYSGAQMPCILFHIPDGHVKEMPTAVKKQAPKVSSPKKSQPKAADAEALLYAVKEVGDTIRQFKKEKADKSVIEGQVKVLVEHKTQYKALTGHDWNPKLVDEIPARHSASSKSQSETVVQPETTTNVDSEAILLKIKEVGDEIRQLKKEKAEKSVVEEKVKVLVDQKAQYKALTRKDWNPKLVDEIPIKVSASTKSQSETAVQSDTKKNASDTILFKIKEVGDEIRQLKKEKAEKSVIEAKVKVLVDQKAQYKAVSGQDWNPKLVDELSPKQSSSTKSVMSSVQNGTAVQSYATKNLNESDTILLAIKEVGDNVRKLKNEKAEKSVIDGQVKILLDHKTQFKALTGKDWTPKLVEQLPAKQSGKSPVAEKQTAVQSDSNTNLSDPRAILLKIKEIGDLIRQLKKEKAEKGVIDREVKILMDHKANYKRLTGNDWSPQLIDAAVMKKDQPKETPAAPAPKPEKKTAPKQPKAKKTEEKKADQKKITRLGLEARKAENFPDWYSQVITKAEMIEYYDVSGCYVLRPWSFSIWEKIERWFDEQIKLMGVDNCYFPMFVSQAALETEKTHIADFAPEVAWVTKSGGSEMSEPIAIRPTSETVMYPSYSKWVQSHRDLPIKLNQWCNVVRWEFKHPTPFLRTREFLWQEGHSAFATRAEAKDEVYAILDLYAHVYEDMLAVPVIKGRKTEREKFAGGDFTTTVEVYIGATGRGVQGATSHHLGQNFSKMFDISFEHPDKPGEKEYAYQNSWAITTRSIGVFIMIHGDDRGLVLPPQVAKIQVIVIPCGITAQVAEEEKLKLHKQCTEIKDRLKAAGIRADVDLRENYSPGWKFNHWELKGVPIRLELGPRDAAKGEFVTVRRDTNEKSTHPQSELVEVSGRLLVDIHDNLFENAKKDLDDHLTVTDDWMQFCAQLDRKCIIMSPFCGDGDCEDKIKKDSAREEASEPGAPAMGAKSLCIPFEQPRALEEAQKCVHPQCSNKAQYYCLFGRSY